MKILTTETKQISVSTSYNWDDPNDPYSFSRGGLLFFFIICMTGKVHALGNLFKSAIPGEVITAVLMCIGPSHVLVGFYSYWFVMHIHMYL